MGGGLAGGYDSDVEAGGLANQMGGGGFGEKAVSKNETKISNQILTSDFFSDPQSIHPQSLRNFMRTTLVDCSHHCSVYVP